MEAALHAALAALSARLQYTWTVGLLPLYPTSACHHQRSLPHLFVMLLHVAAGVAGGAAGALDAA
jgi:hypothetical protein